MRQRDKKGKYYMVLVGAVGVLFGASIGILFFPETQAAAIIGGALGFVFNAALCGVFMYGHIKK